MVLLGQYVLTVLVCMAGVLLLRLVYTSWFFSNLVIDYTMFRSMVRSAPLQLCGSGQFLMDCCVLCATQLDIVCIAIFVAKCLLHAASISTQQSRHAGILAEKRSEARLLLCDQHS